MLETGDDDEAMHYYRETLRVERIALGENHRDLVLTMQHVGQVHQQRGELDDALKYFMEALQIQQVDSAKDPVAMAQTLNLIGNIYLQRGDAADTVSVFAEALRHLRVGGKDFDDLNISGFNFYGLSKMHPECPPVA